MKLLSITLLCAVLCAHTAISCTLGSAPMCDTGVAAGLTSQLITELGVLGVSFAPLSDTNRFRCSTPCVPYLQTAARDSLASATASRNDFITLNSAYRSSAQQYLLFLWHSRGACNFAAVATPGTSNHEGGLGIDTSFYDFWRDALSANSWSWLGSFDPPHFDYVGTDATGGVPQKSLLAFQRLWNRNNPSDQITEDGLYGSNTATRLFRSPCSGW